MPTFSIWQKESFFARQDVIIIGCGFTGLWSALHLKTLFPQYKISIIDRSSIPNGASTRNAGFSCFGSPTELLKDNINMGTDAMLSLVEMRYKGLAEIRRHFDKAIDYDNCGGYECFDTNYVHWDKLKEKLDWLNSKLSYITNSKTTFSIADERLQQLGLSSFSHLIKNKLEGSLNPVKLVKVLIQKVQGLGVQVLTGVDIRSYTETNASVIVYTNLASFETDRLLLCTNAFTKDLIPDIDITPARGQVLVTSPVDNLLLQGTFHCDEGFYYFRNVGNRVLLGGGRNKDIATETTTEDFTTGLIQTELEQFLSNHILKGKEYRITDRWSGIMAMGCKKKPIVKALSHRIFCCIRMSGMGVALAPIVSKQVAELMKDVD